MSATVEKLPESPVVCRDDTYLAPSPHQDDRGFKIGRKPQEITVADLQALGGPQSPIRAIRAKCIDCSAGNAAEVRKCVAYSCALWPFRMGRNPFWGKSDEVEADGILGATED